MTKSEMITVLRETHLVVPREVFDLKLKASDFAVYCYLLSLKHAKSGCSYPGYKNIAKTFQMGSTNTVSACVRRLEDQGMISTEYRTRRKRDGRRKNSSLRYTVHEVEEVREERNWREARRAARLQEIRETQEKANKKGVRIIPNDSIIA